MKFISYVFLIGVFGVILFSNIILDVSAKSADEPCSYLHPEKYTRDANGNCIAKTSVPNQIQNNGNEPCSYLNPEKYYRDTNGNCIERDTVPISVPTTIPSNPDEPCSYLNPEKFIRDSNGQCIRVSPVEEMSPTIFTGGIGNDNVILPKENTGLPWDVILPVLGIMLLLIFLNAKFRSYGKYGRKQLR